MVPWLVVGAVVTALAAVTTQAVSHASNWRPLTGLVRKTVQKIQQRTPARVVRTEHFEPLVRYRDDPVGFCRDILGANPWEVQQQIMEAVRDRPRVTVAACYASGKSWIAACIVLWWIMTRRPALVVTTAPTTRQIKNVLWKEIRKLHKRAKIRLPGRVLSMQLFIDEDWQGIGYSGSGANTRSGMHEEDNVLFVEDEAAGMEPDAVDDFEGLLVTDNCRHLKIGNPVCGSGPFWDSHKHPEESKNWFQICISALKTPNYMAGVSLIKGLVTRAWVELRRLKWGEESPLWITKVLGQFYEGVGGKLITSDLVAQAQGRWGTVPEDGDRILGVDVAVGGEDETVLYRRFGRACKFVDNWRESKTSEQAKRVIAHAKLLAIKEIWIDRTGPGKTLYDRLVEHQEAGELGDIVVEGVNMGESATDPEQFEWRYDEVQWAAKRALEADNPNCVSIDPRDTQLAEELCLRTWQLTNPKYRIKVESKSALAKRGVKSPDYADAFALLFAKPEHKKPDFNIATLISRI